MAKTKKIITIGRQYGSGGREIGEKLSEALDIKLYDSEMLDRAAKDSGLAQEVFESQDEKPTSSFLFSLVTNPYYTSEDMPLNQKVFLAQYDAIRSIADEGPCILVGRCADYALQDYDNLFSVFIYADLNQRIRRVAAAHDLTDTEAKELIQKNDKSRSSYYNYYTNKRWGDLTSYHACLDSSRLGINGTVDTILKMVEIQDQNGKPEIWKE